MINSTGFRRRDPHAPVDAPSSAVSVVCGTGLVDRRDATERPMIVISDLRPTPAADQAGTVGPASPRWGSPNFAVAASACLGRTTYPQGTTS